MVQPSKQNARPRPDDDWAATEPWIRKGRWAAVWLVGGLFLASIQLRARQKQLDVSQKELRSIEPLFKRGFVNQRRLGDLQREEARLECEVSKVSAAELTTRDGRSYFKAQIVVPPKEIKRLSATQRLLPGMPAEVFIEHDARSIMSYLIRPLTDAMTRAFREE